MRALLTLTLPFRFLPSATPSRRFTAASRVISSPFPTNMPTNSHAIALNPRVDSLQQVLQSHPADGWDKCWEQGLTPWDLGRPTPVVEHLCQIGALPMGRALVPGCGSGFDVVCMACPKRFVVGLDVSDKALQRAAELHSSSANADNFVFLKEDFFTWNTAEFFNLIFDYTFFCAIEPELRPTWAQRVADLLRSDGELITLMFPISDHVGGPPYKVSVSDYEEVLYPLGFKAISIEDNELAIRPPLDKPDFSLRTLVQEAQFFSPDFSQFFDWVEYLYRLSASRRGNRENRKVEEINPVLSLNEAYEAKIKDPTPKLADQLQVLFKHLSFV